MARPGLRVRCQLPGGSGPDCRLGPWSPRGMRVPAGSPGRVPAPEHRESLPTSQLRHPPAEPGFMETAPPVVGGVSSPRVWVQGGRSVAP